MSVRAQAYLPDRRGRRYPTHTPGLRACRCNGCHQRRWWTPERRAARADEIRQQYADGRRVWSLKTNLNRRSHWTPEQDDALRSLIGTADLPTIAAEMTRRFGVKRSESAVDHRIQRLGVVRIDVRPLTTGEVARLLGMSRNNLLEIYLRPGLLVPERWRGGRYGMNTYSRAVLEQFIRDHHERLNVAAIRDRGLRDLALALGRGRRPLGVAEVTVLTGLSPYLQYRLYEAGLVPTARRIRRRGAGRSGGWAIDPGDLELVRQLAEERAERLRQRPRDRVTRRFLPGKVAS